MAYEFNGSTQCLYLGSAPVTAVPLTMACFFNNDNATANRRMLCLVKDANTGFYLEASGFIGGDPVSAVSDNGGATVRASTTTGYTVGTWHHCCGVFTSSTSRTAYINGGSAGTNTTSNTPAAPTGTSVGAMYTGSLTSPFDGRIAEPAIWNVALNAAEVASLAKGVSPALIRPESLVFYPPLVRDLTELVGGTSLTAANSPTIAAHPRVYGL